MGQTSCLFAADLPRIRLGLAEDLQDRSASSKKKDPVSLELTLSRVFDSWEIARPGIWKDLPLARVSDDYYERAVRIRNSSGGSALGEVKGAIYVETDKGTRYWANADRDDGNFFFNIGLVNHLIEEFGDFVNLDSLGKTADRFPYLNPQHCR